MILTTQHQSCKLVKIKICPWCRLLSYKCPLGQGTGVQTPTILAAQTHTYRSRGWWEVRHKAFRCIQSRVWGQKPWHFISLDIRRYAPRFSMWIAFPHPRRTRFIQPLRHRHVFLQATAPKFTSCSAACAFHLCPELPYETRCRHLQSHNMDRGIPVFDGAEFPSYHHGLCGNHSK